MASTGLSLSDHPDGQLQKRGLEETHRYQREESQAGECIFTGEVGEGGRNGNGYGYGLDGLVGVHQVPSAVRKMC
jgi:hypothetical protein